MANDLKWIIENGTEEEVEYYLESVSAQKFVADVKKLLASNSDKLAIQEAIKKLQEFL